MLRSVTLIAVFSCVLALAFAESAHAQAVPPVSPAIDANGVDVATGAFTYSQTDLVIGQPGKGGLALTRYYRSGPQGYRTHNHVGYIQASGNTCSVVIGTFTETFTSTVSGCGGALYSDQSRGGMLSISGRTFTYTSSDGTVSVFDNPYPNFVMGVLANLVSVTTPDGVVTNYQYTYDFSCDPNLPICYGAAYLLAVYNNLGYRLAFEPGRTTGINTAIEYCGGLNCTHAWPYATYTSTGNTQQTITNAAGKTTTLTFAGDGLTLTEVQFPDNPDHDINVAYTSNRVASVDLGFGTWAYGYSDVNGERTTTVTNPGSPATSRSYVSIIASGRIKTVTNELGQAISYEYDSSGRQTKVRLPEGNYTQYTYDPRGNITETRQVAKTAGTLGAPADIVTTATFTDPGCSNIRTCNKPVSTTDAHGYRTDYTYDPVHGGLLTIRPPAPTGPAPVGSGDRPQTRVTYAQFQARYLDLTNTLINGTPVWRQTKAAACSSGEAPACVGSLNETVTTTAYPGTSSPNNLLPSSHTVAAGNGAVSAQTSMTYTDWGDVLTVDGPLSGAADTTRYYYDAVRRVVGVVGPDPDGGSPLRYRAVRTTYNDIGQPTFVERGSVANQSATAFSSFTVVEKQESVYDSFGRPVQARLWDGGSIVALTQTSYDTLGRTLCTAVRMNLAGPPADACAAGTESATYGPDRITLNLYDAAGRASEVQSAYATSLAQTTAKFTYTLNGQVETLTDARQYRTRYKYDDFDRRVKQEYPNSLSTNASNSSDYEQFTYDELGHITKVRRRSGDVDSFTLSYDNLGRLVTRDAPGSQPDISYGYDLLGRQTSVSQTGNTIGRIYDALSRVKSETSTALGTVGYVYDAAGRRTQMDYPGGFFVTYTYNTAGDLTSILESGTTTLATYIYDDLGRRLSLTRGNGVVTGFVYDGLSRLRSLQQTGSSQPATFGFSYNPAGQIIERTRTSDAYSAAPPPNFSGNYSANGLNQYTNVFGVPLSYADARGNLTSDGIRSYTYDYDNRLISGGTANLGYDPAGRLQQVAAAGTTTSFLYDGTDLIAEYQSGVVQRRYVHGPGSDEPLVWYEGSGTGDRRWLLADERGSVIGITNGSGTVTDINKYDAYGVPDNTNKGRFQFTGQMWLAEAGVYHFKARAYHPRLGRFLQTDPIGYGGGMNLYAYVGGDPINLVDPGGLYAVCGMLYHKSSNTVIRFDGSVWESSILYSDSAYPTCYDEPDYIPTTLPQPSVPAPNVNVPQGDKCGSSVVFKCHEPEQDPRCYQVQPNGDSVSRNVREMSTRLAMADISGLSAARSGVFLDWLLNVAPMGRWDYKEHRGTEEMGNFNFGATGRLFFNDQRTLLSGAGVVQLLTNPSESSGGIPFLRAPYGDALNDRPPIAQGFRAGCH